MLNNDTFLLMCNKLYYNNNYEIDFIKYNNNNCCVQSVHHYFSNTNEQHTSTMNTTELINNVQEMFPDIADLYDAENPQEWIDASMQAILETQNEDFEYLYDEMDKYSECRKTYTFEMPGMTHIETFDIVHEPSEYLGKGFKKYACDKLEELTGYCAERMVLRETEVPRYFSVAINTDDEMNWQIAEEFGKMIAMNNEYVQSQEYETHNFQKTLE